MEMRWELTVEEVAVNVVGELDALYKNSIFTNLLYIAHIYDLYEFILQ